jgi:hypothetical protein
MANNECDASCPVCGSKPGHYRQPVNKYAIIKCGNCGLEFTTPIPSAEELNRFYSEYEDIRADAEIVKLNAEAHLKVLKKYGWSPLAKTLDFGAGQGIFVEVAGKNCFGVELQNSNNVRIKQSLHDQVGGTPAWDFITLWGVLEHLPYPKDVMAELASRLKPRGVMALTTVDAEGVIPYYYKPPEHLTYWTLAAFEMLAGRCGLTIAEHRPYQMFQNGQIYFDRLLSRTPEEYRSLLHYQLPKIVQVPTNEVFVLFKKP